jgi:hypothetical protein
MPPTYPRLRFDYITDEDVVIIAGADYEQLASRWSRFAAGTDGAFDPSDRWTLTSASCDFEAQGVGPGMACWLAQYTTTGAGGAPKSVRLGDLLFVESASGHSLLLRREGEEARVGQPPAPGAGLANVEFLVTSLRNAIDEVAYELDQMFGVKEGWPNRDPSDEEDQRIFRRMAVYDLLAQRYENATRDDKGDFAQKAKAYRDRFDRARDMATVRWGPTGRSQPGTTVFGTRLAR